MTEEEFLKSNHEYIRTLSFIFMRRAGLTPASFWFPDVFQEASMALLLWHRKAQERGCSPEMEHNFAHVVVHRALFGAFIDRDGIGVHSHNLHNVQRCRGYERVRKSASEPHSVTTDDGSGVSLILGDSSSLRSVYARDWLDSLSEPDRKLVLLLAKGYKRPDILDALGISSTHFYTRRKNLRKTYDEYCSPEAG